MKCKANRWCVSPVTSTIRHNDYLGAVFTVIEDTVISKFSRAGDNTSQRGKLHDRSQNQKQDIFHPAFDSATCSSLTMADADEDTIHPSTSVAGGDGDGDLDDETQDFRFLSSLPQ